MKPQLVYWQAGALPRNYILPAAKFEIYKELQDEDNAYNIPKAQ